MTTLSESSTATAHQGAHATARLRRLGLRPEDLVRAIQAAEMERASCSSLEPSISPGFKAWAAAFRTLAEVLVPRGWEKTESRGLPRLLNPETSVAVAVVAGDEGTGVVYGEPRSKSPRGSQSIFLVRSNEVQLSLQFEPLSSTRPIRPLPAEEEQITWWLLIYSHGQSVRAELSLPIGLGEDNRLSTWEERIILDLPDMSVPLVPGDNGPPLEFEIDVRPRS